jgi:cation transport regulator ChaC
LTFSGRLQTTLFFALDLHNQKSIAIIKFFDYFYILGALVALYLCAELNCCIERYRERVAAEPHSCPTTTNSLDPESKPSILSEMMKLGNTLVFSYGSNGTKQLRGRVKNPDLITRPAILHGYVRVFSFAGPGVWGGSSAASLAPSEEPGARTLGGVASLTPQELALLDTYEGGYRKVNITVSVKVGEEEHEEMPAIAYIAGVKAKPFTPAIEAQPTLQYLWAIYGNLREHWQIESVVVRTYDPVKGPVVLNEWMVPSSLHELTLDALCVEISLNRTVSWVMPKTIYDFVGRLKQVNILTTSQLAQVFEDSPQSMNEMLVAKELKPFDDETIDILTRMFSRLQ